MVILQSFSVKVLLTFDNNSNNNNSSSSVTITMNNNNYLITKQLKQDSIPSRKGIYIWCWPSRPYEDTQNVALLVDDTG
jgi:hypothetical protein